jgi:threonine aldolase
VLVEEMAHILRAESAGSALCSSVLFEPVPSERGVFTPEEMESSLRKATVVPEPYAPPASLVCVEQTHNFGGGAIWPIRQLKAIRARSRFLGLKVHMDGARLLNAVIASGVSAAEFASCSDSVWLDFTKGLGAPLGAVLAGDRDFIVQARRYKQVFGGAMRQAGIAAAGCLYALEYNVERLAEDHANAKLLARGLAKINGVNVRSTEPETNMVFFDAFGAGLTNSQVVQSAEQQGISMGIVGQEIRLVTHIDVSTEDIDETIAFVAELVASA